ncbi:MAG: HD domain-containing protein [Pseudomonadota bacterium]
MQMNDAKARLAFLEAAEALKDVERSGFTSKGRPEDSAAHSWRLCLWVLVFEDQLGDVDLLKLLKICILHDLGEAISGDIPAPLQQEDKSKAERADFETLTSILSKEQQHAFLDAWDEYQRAETREAQIAKGLDKLETILQHVQGANPDNFDYAFNLNYARDATSKETLLKFLRELLDEKTRARISAG